jgi:hypothetical protein
LIAAAQPHTWKSNAIHVLLKGRGNSSPAGALHMLDHLPGRTDTTDDAMAALLLSIKLVQDAAEPFNKMAETIKPVVNTFKDVGDVVGGVYDVSRQMPGSCQAMYAYMHTW